MKNSKLELTWVNKGDQKRLEPRVLVEDKSYSYGAGNSAHGELGNSLIFGDNLLALKALEQDFSQKIKCVFLDPPYNTGSAFTHYDDGIEHSLWLTMMRDRLEIIRNLMSQDGSIWISVDDNEGHYLKVLCDEIFGRANFVSTVIWQKKYTQANDAVFFSDNHDFILVYAKDRTRFILNRLPREEKQNQAYKNPDKDPRGPWKATPLHAKSGSDANFSYTFRNGVVFRPPVGTFSRFSAERLKKMDDNNEIWFGRNGDATPSRKTFLSDVSDGIVPKSIWLHDEVGHNHEARTEAKAFVPADPFATPKPERLLQRILHLATEPGDWVLDSFAGSGTTGAVAHKMGRRWIMVELGDHCHTHIVPRMRQIIDGTDRGGISTAVDWQGGGAFRYYSLSPSLLKKDRWGNWVVNKDYNAEMLAKAMCKHEGFQYAPSESVYWQHGHSTERDFIYVTTQSLTHDQVVALSEEVGDERSLLVCCTAFKANADDFPQLTLKKIPQAILGRCEFGRDDYSLDVEGSQPAPPDDQNESFIENARAAQSEAPLMALMKQQGS